MRVCGDSLSSSACCNCRSRPSERSLSCVCANVDVDHRPLYVLRSVSCHYPHSQGSKHCGLTHRTNYASLARAARHKVRQTDTTINSGNAHTSAFHLSWRLLSQNTSTKTQYYNYVCRFVWVWNLVSYTQKRTDQGWRTFFLIFAQIVYKVQRNSSACPWEFWSVK
jgi:hypothetical protein